MPDGNAAAQRVLGIAKAMRECGCEVRFCGLSRNISSIYEDGEIDGFVYRNYRYPVSGKSWLKYLMGLDASIREIEDYKPGIVVLYNHPSFAIERITRYCHKKGIKVVADVTEWYEVKGNPVFRIVKGFDTSRRMKQSHKKLDGLICISDYLTDYYGSCGLPLLSVPPLVDKKQAKWNQEDHESPDVVRIIYAGSPGLEKDELATILKSLSEIKDALPRDIHFDILGITHEQYQARWGDKQEYPFISFHGRLSHGEVLKFLKNADFQVFIRPDNLQNRAGFPTKFVETITSRTIPITNLSSDLSKYISDGYNGFVIGDTSISSVRTTLQRALSLPAEEIQRVKDNIDADVFDYHHYLNLIQEFVDSLR